jgi:Mrp family chromosome partitioning ATPase
LKLILAALAGLLGGIGLAFGWEFLDSSIRKPDDVETRLRLPTLASIPRLAADQVSLSAERSGSNGTSPDDKRWHLPLEAAQSFETLRDRLLLAVDGTGARPLRLGFTSCYAGEGVSTTAANLALTLARQGERPVLLVDANLQAPSLHERLGLQRGPGVAEILSSGSGTVVPVEKNLFALPAGEPHRNLPDALAPQKSDHLTRLLNDATYGYVIVDLPPLSEGAGSLRLARLVSGVVMVIECEQVRGEAARRARNLLHEARVPLLGVVLNKRIFYIPDWIYHRL